MKPPRFEGGIFVQQGPDAVPGGSSALERQELPLEGKHVFITGGNRDVGRGILAALVTAGADVGSVYHHIGQTSQVDQISKEAESQGRHVEFILADITLEGGRDAVSWMVRESFWNAIDVLVLNASGEGEDINVVANNALVDWYLHLRSDRVEKGEKLGRGAIVLMQSVPGHFSPQLKDSAVASHVYDPIARVKHRGEATLRRRIDEFESLGAGFFVVAPPIVEGTFNMRLFRRQDPEIDQKMKEISTMLGLPDKVTVEEVGERVVALIERDDLPQGYVELFGNTIDARSAGLSDWYGESAIYVDTIEKIDEDSGVGRMIVTKDQCDRAGDPSFQGEVIAASWSFLPSKNNSEAHITTQLPITGNHSKDHFKKGLMQVVPGHHSIRFAVETAAQLYNYLRRASAHMRLLAFDSVEFTKPILPGEEVRVEFTKAEGSTLEHPKGRAVITKMSDGQVATIIEGLECEVVESVEEAMLENKLIESWAQSLGMVGLGDEGGVPLFESIGRTEFYQRAHPGDAIANFVQINERPRQGFGGNVYCWSGENVVGVSKDLKARVLTSRQARRIFGQPAA